MSNNVEFLTVKKNNEVLQIHPTTLEAHKRAGWALTDEEVKPEKTKAEKTSKKAPEEPVNPADGKS